MPEIYPLAPIEAEVLFFFSLKKKRLKWKAGISFINIPSISLQSLKKTPRPSKREELETPI